MNTILQVCLPLPRRLQLRWTSVLLFNYFNVQFLNISGPVLGWSAGKHICNFMSFGKIWTNATLSTNSIQIQQEAIHHKRFTVLTNSKGFSLQLIGIWPKPYPIWPSSQLCQVFRGPPLPTCRQQRENSFRTLRMCICLRLYSYLVHTHMLPLI